MNSPYKDIPEEKWINVTETLVEEYPLSSDDIIDIVLNSWESILNTKVGGKLQIGEDIFPSPQVMGNYLHELIPIELEELYPGEWTKDLEKNDKDIEYLLNNKYSTEIKTSSNPYNVFGNRSYAQPDNLTGKGKSGYYITINYEKFDKKNPDIKPKIKKIRLGWLDHTDWIAQKAATGQQSRIDVYSRDNKLKLIYNE